jgi:hypothetical protein
MGSQANRSHNVHRWQFDSAQMNNTRRVRLTRHLCGLKEVGEPGNRVAVELPPEVQLSVIRPLDDPDFLEVTDGSEKYVVFSRDFVDRCELLDS